ncbi:little finger domain-containing protein [Cryptosporidium canis]|uniref:Little finger domain-containing protein n=1 Tax=Cryptosporidium canis TaxID=195482 RepID=A0A9D5HVT7_9CRYT|nr:little finger domain-containing protein [Cryptosporidium canis]
MGLDFDHKPISSITSSTTTTPSTSTSKSASTPSIASMINGASTFTTDQSYFDEISNMIDNSHLETPQTCRIGNSSHLLRIPKQQQGIGGTSCSGTVHHGVVSQTSCSAESGGGGKILLSKEQQSATKEPPVSGTHPAGVMNGSAMMGIFSSPKSFVCTLSSTRSTSAPYTPTVVDECSPPCSLPAPPGSDPFAISGFGSETRSTDPIPGDFSAPLLNYLNDGLGSDSWGGFVPYSKITDYCFDNSPEGGNLGSSGGASITHSHGSSTAASTPSSGLGSSISQGKWNGSVLAGSGCVNTPGPGNKAVSASPSSQPSTKATEILDSLLMDIIKEGHAGNIFEYASYVLNSATSLLAIRFNKEPPTSQPPPPSGSAPSPAGGGNWSPNALGVGGPNFAAPTMLAHPDEFKNPSSFLKIYGDPLCGKQPSSSAISASHDFQTGSSGAGFPNANPMKGQNGNWACCKCSNVNFPRRFRCFKCGEYRDEVGDKIVAEYAKHVYLHHLKAYRSFNSGNAGGGSGRSGMNQGASSSFGEGMQPMFVQRSNSNNGGFMPASPSNLNYMDSSGTNNGSKHQSSPTPGEEAGGSNSNSTCSTNSTVVSPVSSGSITSQTAKKSSKVLTAGL